MDAWLKTKKALASLSSSRFAAWSCRWSKLITAIGALALFFSWIADDTLKEQYTKIKQEIESAERDSEISRNLLEIRERVRDILSELGGSRRIVRGSSDPTRNKLLRLDAEFRMTQISAGGVLEVAEFASRALAFSKARPNRTFAIR